MAIVCEGILFYDIRTCWKGTVGDVAIDKGDSVCLCLDGLIYPVNADSQTNCHGWALTDKEEGEELTVFTTGRIKVATAQTIANRVNCGNTEVLTGTGSPPSTTFTGGLDVGFAYKEYEMFVSAQMPPAAQGEAAP